MKVTYKVQVWFIIWWTTDEVHGNDAWTLSQSAWKIMDSKPKLLKKLKWHVTGG